MTDPTVSLLRQFFSPGVRYVLLAAFGFTFMQALVKELDHIHTFELIFFRASITSLLCIIYLSKQKVSLFGNNKKLLLLRAFFGLIAITSFFITIERIPFGASVSLKYLSPIFTAIFAMLILKEKVRPIQWLFFLMAFLGVVLMKGFDTRIDLISLLLGISGALFSGLVYITIRKIGSREHSLVIVNYFMFFTAAIIGLLAIPHWTAPSSSDWPLLILIGVSGFFAQLFMTKAFQIELASKIVPVRYIEVVYALLVGLIWFGESYNLWTLLGIVLVVSGMVLNVLFKPK